MSTSNLNNYIILSLLLIAWCSLHSALISVTLSRYLQNHFADKYRYYRLFFNLIAVFTLIPVALYRFSIPSEMLFEWDGYLHIVQVILIALGIVLFFLGAAKYDARRFLGLSQLKESTSRKGLTASGKLETSGILNIIRHPWYTSLLLILWARSLDASALIVNLVFSGYLLIGARLEENKLIEEFGDSYQQYQQRVSMLFPFKWLKARLSSPAVD